MSQNDASNTTSVRKLAPLAVGLVLMAVCLGFIAKTLSDDWGKVSDSLAHASLAWLGIGLASATAGMSVIAFTWADALAVVGGKMSRTKSIAWYYVGEIAKYIPGSIWAAVGRGEIARRRGIPTSQAYPSVVLSLIGLYLAAALSAALLLPFDLAHSRNAGPALLLLLLVPIGLGFLHPRVLGAFFGFIERVTKRKLGITIPAWRDTMLLMVRYVPAWVGIAAATWCAARALPGVDAPVLRIALATVLSWTAGFVTPTPGGAGVREAVFIAVSGLAAAPAVAVAVTARIMFVIVDVGGALCGLPLTRHQSSAAASVDSNTYVPVEVEEKG